MKIYVAGSWKNSKMCINISNLLMQHGHETDCFCDPSKDRFLFFYQDMPNIEYHDGITIMECDNVKKAFAEDKKWIDWADAVVLVLPSGKSAHLEAGYAKGAKKKLFIYGNFPIGEYDVMYGFADGLFRSITELILKLNDEQTKMLREKRR